VEEKNSGLNRVKVSPVPSASTLRTGIISPCSERLRSYELMVKRIVNDGSSIRPQIVFGSLFENGFMYHKMAVSKSGTCQDVLRFREAVRQKGFCILNQ
jgi:hypothetical protein